MRIGILGTGTMASALGAGWVRAGHEVVVGGRSRDRARRLAHGLGGSPTASAGRHGRPVSARRSPGRKSCCSRCPGPVRPTWCARWAGRPEHWRERR
ncbi:NAD(P)-binding domain-containing protein [Actinoalloteichus caeruleus]|uniref:NAD(P)-binding domain-containing protein n=1 Tax=Actinoalloteichus sp. AHMU CJ021 TaxID=2072503 RepID=UPI0027E2DAEA|nr:NAD(P)-binding domain-containing protein [Actinoalloteichus caeruleus]